MTVTAVSPASSGPAGSHFEAQVGAHYLLSMLVGTEPRGLPGTTIDRIQLQGAAEGRPLDDIVVHAHDPQGDPAVLEIQVKRSITFSPGDSIFRAVVGQIVEASRRPDFWTSRYELAIATARTSRKIDGPYQDVLTWARQLTDAATFLGRIARSGSANDDMRSFVRTFKSHMRDFGSPDDDETAWRLLRKLQILVFDFTAQGSASEELVRERAVRALHADDALRAGNLWTTLVELAVRVAASGGERTREGLIEYLRGQSFRFAGYRRYSSARAALGEASRNALADISDRVGDVMLTRHERVAAVHAALDSSRYVEIRGDAGVGKSGVLKHFAEQIATEASVIVLSPNRTTPNGWTAMRAVLGFDGTAHDLLTDIAGDGGAVLFVDNADLFKDGERRTVVDLVREAASVPGFVVIVTARRNFGVEEPSWLPLNAIERLGCADPIFINELNDAEVDEIRHAVPRLAPLLADTHPARDVTRNLFRLARLASRPGNEPVPRTEAEMAEQWWQTSDGRLDGNLRERARLLKALAEQALSHAEPLDVSDYPVQAVNELVASETLRDLGNDRVVFCHDVLREWAIASLLYSESTTIELLPVDRRTSAVLARGIELTSRMILERAGDVTRWQSLVERLSRDGTHGSWRRAALLALVRSEVAFEVLTRASTLLFANRASMLRELIRIVMAVDVEPASKRFEGLGLDPGAIPATLNIPRGPSWPRLISWLLSLGDGLPVAAVPDVVDLYTAWPVGTLGSDPLTPSLVRWFYRWLTEMEASREAGPFWDRREPFNGEIEYERLSALENDIRNAFVIFSHRTPELAAEYLRSLGEGHRREDIIRSVLTFRGSLAKAAPAELAELTASSLIPSARPQDRDRRQELRGPLRFLDDEFLPASPAQGPFFDLLVHSPQHGLSLIRRLVDEVVCFYSQGAEHGSDAITIPFPDGDRVFPWKRSYAWSRDQSGAYSLTSALLALEAWAHRRIDGEENFDTVLGEVLGPPGSPAAYLLVAVDLFLSHWPKSQEVAVPFLACPELLCLDHERHLHDTFEEPDFFGLNALLREPAGTVSIRDLKGRPSRQYSLKDLLGRYTVFGPPELRDKICTQLRRAAARLGQPDEQSDLGDPAFMVVHAMNLVDPNNWRETAVTLPDGTQDTAHEYVAPETESRHLAALQAAVQDDHLDTNMQFALGTALENPSRSSPKFAAAVVEWAQSAENVATNEEPHEARTRGEAIVAAATILMRDGDPELRARHAEWARGIFARALQTKEDPVHRARSGLRFNPIAIAFVGLIHALKDGRTTDDVAALLEVAGRDNPAAAHGFGVAAMILSTIDERLLRAVLRSAFTACVWPSRNWQLPEEELAVRSEHHRNRVQAAIHAELAWLAGNGPEPSWSEFPREMVRRREGIRIPKPGEQPVQPPPRPAQPKEYADHQAAALWLAQTHSFADARKLPWLRDVVRTYAPWTAEANGAGLNEDEQITHTPREWNNAYFDLLAHCLPDLALPEIEQLALTPINSLPDEPFFDVLTIFLRSVDAVFFSDSSLQEAIAISIRSTLANRMMASSGWKRLGLGRSASIERHIGPAIAVILFNDYSMFESAKCYLLPQAVDRLDSFLPLLEKLVGNGPSLFVAIATLNLLEVSPRSAHLPFMITASMVWLKKYPDDNDFWIDHGIGRRACKWIEKVWREDPSLLNPAKPIRSDVDRLLAGLIRLGLADAKVLEDALADGAGTAT